MGNDESDQEYSAADLDKIHQLLTARGMAVPKEALVEILGTPQGKELLMQMKQLQQAEEEQRSMLSRGNTTSDSTTATNDNNNNDESDQEYSAADLDKIHQLLTARGMAGPKEALVEILGTPQGK